MRIIYIFCLLIIIISLSVLIKKLCFSKHFDDNLENFESSAKLIIYTTKWCGNCRRLKPTIKKLKKKIHKELSIHVEEIDCDDNRDKCSIINNGSKVMIKSVPTIILRKEGKDDVPYTSTDNKLTSLFDFVKSNIKN